MPASQTVNPLINLFPLVLLFIVFYFLLIRPQKQRDKQHQKMLSNLNKNDEVVTSSGIHGVVVGVKDKTILLRVDENVKIEVEKNCIVFVKSAQANN